MIPVSRANFWPPCAVAPHTHTRISLLEFPPSIGRLLMRLTVRPRLAAAIAAHVPARPPPTTVTSADESREIIDAPSSRSFDAAGSETGDDVLLCEKDDD